MISEQALAALMKFELDKNDPDVLVRLKAKAAAREHGLVDGGGKLKPECRDLLNAMKTSVKNGEAAAAVTAAACKTFNLPENKARDLYNSLRT